MRISKITFCILLFLQSCSTPDKRYTQWRVTGGSKENIRYSTLDQIDTTNVNQLKVAWVYHTNDADTVNHSQIQCNPIIVDGILYGTSPQLKLLALDAATGKEKWRFDPQAEKIEGNAAIRFNLNNNRGVTYWEEKEDKRIFYTVGHLLFSIGVATGVPVKSFGDNGKIDLHEGLGRNVKDLYVASTSPGIIYKNLLIMGSRVSEGSDAAPGHIRAYDVKTGKQQWIFHTIPQPGEFGFDSWEDSIAYKHIGGANSWSGFSIDEKRGMLFAPTGSASFDFYGGMRKGANLFANSIIALDAATGKYIWHFQTLHHDVWDKDIPTPPSLVTINHEGKLKDAVAQPTKNGFIFLLDRETGKPIFPIEEQPVPTNTELKGEKLYPTQPVPTLPKPFMRQTFTEADLNDLLPDSSFQDIKTRFLNANKGSMFTPPSKTPTIFYPGLDGGAEWGGSAFDPETNLFYVNANEIPWLMAMRDMNMEVPKSETFLTAGQRLYVKHCSACHGANRKGTGNNPTILGIENRYNEKSFSELLTTGRRMMPAFAYLSEQDSKAIASFILDLKAEQRKVFVSEPVRIDSFRNLPYHIVGYNKFISKEGYPAIKPPWGTLNAVNLSTGEIAWRIPLGEFPEFKKKGIITGTENYGGPVVTKTGVLFIAATSDGKFRAFNKSNGKILWETDLPAAGFATPSMYEVNGKQFIVIACGGSKLGTKTGDAYVAFALPEAN
jgi:quinoprotein glucose dehydrogenase